MPRGKPRAARGDNTFCNPLRFVRDKRVTIHAEKILATLAICFQIIGPCLKFRGSKALPARGEFHQHTDHTVAISIRIILDVDDRNNIDFIQQ